MISYSWKSSKTIHYNTSQIEQVKGFIVLTNDQYHALISTCTVLKIFDTNMVFWIFFLEIQNTNPTILISLRKLYQSIVSNGMVLWKMFVKLTILVVVKMTSLSASAHRYFSDLLTVLNDQHIKYYGIYNLYVIYLL